MFALSALPPVVEKPDRKIVYLIDTINGKQQILQNYNTKPSYSNWMSDVQDCDIEIRLDDNTRNQINNCIFAQNVINCKLDICVRCLSRLFV